MILGCEVTPRVVGYFYVYFTICGFYLSIWSYTIYKKLTQGKPEGEPVLFMVL